MKIANSVKLSVFAKDEEDPEKIKNKFLELIPFNLEEEKINLEQRKAIGFEEKEIRIFEILLEKEKHVNMFLENLIKNLSSETKEIILRQAETRLDDECNFFLRFSKDKLIKENELWLTDQGNCFHIKLNIAAFPKKKETALEIIRKAFKVVG
jgi:RNA binding exosome subunit